MIVSMVSAGWPLMVFPGCRANGRGERLASAGGRHGPWRWVSQPSVFPQPCKERATGKRESRRPGSAPAGTEGNPTLIRKTDGDARVHPARAAPPRRRVVRATRECTKTSALLHKKMCMAPCTGPRGTAWPRRPLTSPGDALPCGHMSDLPDGLPPPAARAARCPRRGPEHPPHPSRVSGSSTPAGGSGATSSRPAPIERRCP